MLLLYKYNFMEFPLLFVVFILNSPQLATKIAGYVYLVLKFKPQNGEYVLKSLKQNIFRNECDQPTLSKP